MMNLLDSPPITAQVFHPRPTAQHSSNVEGALDGTIPVEDDIVIGYRLYPHTPTAPLLLFFHGNGEVAADYDLLAPMFAETGVSALIVDYRGYGWSTGKPLVSRMLPDAAATLDALPGILTETDINTDVPLFVMGRSLGSAPAVYLAHQSPNRFRGLIVESGFADAPSLFGRLGIIIPDHLLENVNLPLNNEGKLADVPLPLLVIHGERDQVIPVDHGQRLFDAAQTDDKTLLRVPNVGHNDLLARARSQYMDALQTFVADH